MARKRFVYKGRSVESIKKRANQQGGGFDSYIKDDVPRYKPGDGENIIRVLPPTWIDDDDLVDKWGDSWGVEIWVHYGIGPDEVTYLCPKKMLGEDCPLCDARSDVQRDDEEAAKALAPGKRVGVWLIDRKAQKEGPQFWAMPAFKVEKEIASRSINKKTGKAILIDDPENGYDVSFNKDGPSERPNYTGVDVDRDPSPLHDKESVQDKWLEYIQNNPLYDVLKFYDFDYIESVYMGKKKKKKRSDDEDEHEEEDRKKKSRRSRDEEEDEDEEPKKKRSKYKDDEDDRSSNRKSKTRHSDEDEDEDEDDKRSSRRSKREEEDDEDEDEPRSKKKDKSSEARKSIEKLKKSSRYDEDDEIPF